MPILIQTNLTTACLSVINNATTSTTSWATTYLPLSYTSASISSGTTITAAYLVSVGDATGVTMVPTQWIVPVESWGTANTWDQSVNAVQFQDASGALSISASSIFHAPPQTEAEKVRLQIEKDAREMAKSRAEALLNRHIREDQRRTLREHGWIQVVSRKGNRYRVYRGRSHNVKLLDSQDREVMSYCAHPTMQVPEADCMLSQMLMLELAEDRFLALANKYPIAPTVPRYLNQRLAV